MNEVGRHGRRYAPLDQAQLLEHAEVLGQVGWRRGRRCGDILQRVGALADGVEHGEIGAYVAHFVGE